MEDYNICIQDLHIFNDIKVSYFGVFDGHGGDQCAKFLKETLHKLLAESLTKLSNSFLKQTHDFAMSDLATSDDFYQTLELLIREAYENTD